jgi:chromosome segregation ATPase
VYGANTKKYKEYLKSANEKIVSTESDIKAKNNQYTAQEGIRNTQNQLAADIEAQRLSTSYKDAVNAIKKARVDIQRLEAEKAAIKGKGKAKKQQAKQDEIDILTRQIETHRNYLRTNSGTNLARAKQAATAAEAKMTSLQTETAKLQDMLNRLNTHRSNLETRVGTHSRAFDRLVKFKPMVRQFNGKDYVFGTKFTEADLINQGLFKQGGSINRNKINKFLNYAKG